MARETNIHAGHRESMRQKYLALGPSVFHPHELLEILLYYAVHMQDTNPTAHRLLDRFGRLGAVLEAEESELLSVRGVGEKIVRLLRLVRQLGQRFRSVSLGADSREALCISLEELVLSLSDESESETDVTRLILLDGGGRLLAAPRIFNGTVLSPSFEMRYLVEPAIRHRAVAAVLCTYPRSRSLRPGMYDYEVTASLRDALALVGVRLAEHFIVSGDYAARLSRRLPGCLGAEAEIPCVFGIGSRPSSEDTQPLAALLDFGGYSVSECEVGDMILALGGTGRFMNASVPELVRLGIPRSAALLLSLSIALYLRASLTEWDTAKPLNSAGQLGDFFVRNYLGETSERVLLLLLDKSDRLLRTVPLSEGVVNGAPIEIRRVLELALLHGAASVVLAHNHPSGSPIPSPEDEETTVLLSDALASVDLPLLEHFVIAGESYTPIRLASPRLSTVRPLSFYGDELISRVSKLKIK